MRKLLAVAGLTAGLILGLTGPAAATGSHGDTAVISVDFNCESVDVESSKDLSNVVVDNGTSHYKHDGLTGKTGTFTHPDGGVIATVWVKSGSNSSGDGPGYGKKFSALAQSCEGPTGPPGEPGPTGPQGDPGDDGSDGLTPIAVCTGTPGGVYFIYEEQELPEGHFLVSAEAPCYGPAGPAGEDGTDGVDGVNGKDGANGVDGAAGSAGVAGPQGPAGTSTPTEVAGETLDAPSAPAAEATLPRTGSGTTLALIGGALALLGLLLRGLTVARRRVNG